MQGSPVLEGALVHMLEHRTGQPEAGSVSALAT